MANVMTNVPWQMGHVTQSRGTIGKGGACSKPGPACPARGVDAAQHGPPAATGAYGAPGCLTQATGLFFLLLWHLLIQI